MSSSQNIIPNLQLREEFINDHSVIDNGFEIVGSPTIDNGISGFDATNYATFNHRFGYSFSFFARLVVSDTATFERVFENTSTYTRVLWNGTSKKYYMQIYIGGVSRSISIATDMSSLDGQEVTIGFTCDFDGTNTTLTAYLNGIYENQVGPYAGHNEGVSNPIYLGISSGLVSQFTGTLKDIQFYNTVLTEGDFLKLHNNTLTKELDPEESILFLPCDKIWTNGSGKTVTSVLGTTITEAELGDGTTSSTFPTLSSNKREYYFDGGDWINCGDNDAFTLLMTEPFSICGLFKIQTTLSKIFMGKHDGSNGEWYLYTTGIGQIVFVMYDDVDGGARVWNGSTGKVKHNTLQSFCFTYDGSNTVSLTSGKLYIDGENVNSSNGAPGVFTSVRNTNKTLAIGSRTGTGSYTTGYISLPQIKRTELSPLQVKILDRWMKTSWRHR